MSSHALLARPLRCALLEGPLMSLFLHHEQRAWSMSATSGAAWRRCLSFTASKAASGHQRAPYHAAYFGCRQIQPKHSQLNRRSFSHASHLRRRWMERQQQTAPAQTHQPLLHTAASTWRHPTHAWTATYGLIGLFVAVWCAHNYSEGGTILPNGIPLPKPPGWDSVTNFFGLRKPKSSVLRKTHTPTSIALAIEEASQEIKTNFSSAALSYRTSDYPPRNWDPEHVYPFVASMFAHFEPLHLAINSYWTYTIMPILMIRIGIPRTLAVYVLGGILTADFQCRADKAYALNQAPWLFRLIKAAQRDPDPNATLNTQHVGSTGALFTLGTVRALAIQQRAFRLFALFVVSLDVIGYYYDLDTGVGYTNHLTGVVAGGLLWFGWLRWTKVERLARLAAGRL